MFNAKAIQEPEDVCHSMYLLFESLKCLEDSQDGLKTYSSQSSSSSRPSNCLMAHKDNSCEALRALDNLQTET
jgi:hypothetical protein